MQQVCLRMNPGTRSQNTSPLNTMLFSARLGFLLPRTLTSLAQSYCFLVTWAQPPLFTQFSLPLHLIPWPNSTPDVSNTQAPEEEAVQRHPPRSHAGQTLKNPQSLETKIHTNTNCRNRPVFPVLHDIVQN